MTALTDDEVDVARAATPGCAEVIHLNHAGAPLPPQVVLDRPGCAPGAEASVGGFDVALVSLTHILNNGGLVNPAASGCSPLRLGVVDAPPGSPVYAAGHGSPHQELGRQPALSARAGP